MTDRQTPTSGAPQPIRNKPSYASPQRVIFSVNHPNPNLRRQGATPSATPSAIRAVDGCIARLGGRSGAGERKQRAVWTLGHTLAAAVAVAMAVAVAVGVAVAVCGVCCGVGILEGASAHVRHRGVEKGDE
eukprot:scaffold31808_cov45-Phaeocystis_antarctica.AAC.2